MKTLALFAVLALVATPVLAQSTLAITGTINPGNTVTVGLTGGSASDPAFLAIGQTTGTSVLTLGPLGTLTLGLASPYVILPVGMTDASGALNLSFAIPSNLPATMFPSSDKYVQAVTVDFTFTMPGPGTPWTWPTLSFNTSNVATIHIGP